MQLNFVILYQGWPIRGPHAVQKEISAGQIRIESKEFFNIMGVFSQSLNRWELNNLKIKTVKLLINSFSILSVLCMSFCFEVGYSRCEIYERPISIFLENFLEQRWPTQRKSRAIFTQNTLIQRQIFEYGNVCKLRNAEFDYFWPPSPPSPLS